MDIWLHPNVIFEIQRYIYFYISSIFYQIGVLKIIPFFWQCTFDCNHFETRRMPMCFLTIYSIYFFFWGGGYRNLHEIPIPCAPLKISNNRWKIKMEARLSHYRFTAYLHMGKKRTLDSRFIALFSSKYFVSIFFGFFPVVWLCSIKKWTSNK